MIRRSSLRPGSGPRQKSPIKRTGRIRPKKRRASEFAREFHSVERVKFVRALGCLVSYCGEQSQNHHIENGGTSRKADYDRIVPLCHLHHRQCHHIGRESFQRVYGLNLETAAVQTEAAWLAHRSNDDAA